jgi:hypothetical protein
MARIFHFHDALNSKLWDGDRLKPLVRLKLFQTAVAFYKFLDIDRLIVIDIIFTGSNAAYNYTKLSDVDVHLIVDFAASACPKLADNLFTTKKALWGQTYSTSVFGCPVELYVEDAANPVKANGIFSLLRNMWLKKPSPERPDPDDAAIRLKRDFFHEAIEDLLDGEPGLKEIDALIAKLRKMRQNGLEEFGEFANENLVYKALRDSGDLQKLYQQRIAIRDKELSLR